MKSVLLALAASLAFVSVAGRAWGQVSVEEARARLEAKQRAAAATQPAETAEARELRTLKAEVQRLRAENDQLRTALLKLKPAIEQFQKVQAKAQAEAAALMKNKEGVRVGGTLDDLKAYAKANHYHLRVSSALGTVTTFEVSDPNGGYMLVTVNGDEKIVSFFAP